MDENNMENENGFVMVDSPVTEDVTENVTENATENTIPETESGLAAESGQEAENTQTVESEQNPNPMPMPSGDNTYRFQNIEVQKQRKKKKDCKGMSVPRVIACAILFGVVAAACFWGVESGLSWLTDRGRQIAEVDTSENNGVTLSTVSGTAASVADVSGVVDMVMPSIVAITEKSTQTSYFGQTYSSEGAGSGFIVKQDDDQLLIVTNNHVVADADTISVQFIDDEVVDATVKGTSESNDLAVLTVPLKSLKDSTRKTIRVASLGNSDEAKVGQMVIAIGNALGYGQSVTVGYLSAKNREVSASDDSGSTTTQILMQTDAAINPGNSGGALIDTHGNVIGINSSKYFSYGNTTVEGMGYAIPMSDAVSVINDLMNREVLKDSEKGYLGITGRSISDSVSQAYGIPVGVYVAAVSDTGAAYKAGIKQGDVIVAIDGTTVKTIEEVQEKVNSTKSGTTIKVTIKRSSDGEYKEKEIDVTLKGRDTLDGLEDDTTQQQPDSSQDYNGYGNEDDSQVIPWGGSIY